MSLLDLYVVATKEERPWPVKGNIYPIVFEVEHIGPNYDDEPYYLLLEATPEVREVVGDSDFESATHKDDRPIASGLYKADLKFWQYQCSRGLEDLYDEWEYGFTLSNLKKLPENPHVQDHQR
jgi:hypothetical protein